MKHRWLGMLFGLICLPAMAGDVEVVKVELVQQGKSWTVHATLKHDDTGWDHYANAWRVLDEKGNVLGTRKLWHPHVNEQPFTRSLDGIVIPNGVRRVIVEAQDSVHGWSGQRVTIDLQKTRGDRFEVRRR